MTFLDSFFFSFLLSDKFHQKFRWLENVQMGARRQEIYSSRQTGLTFILPFSHFLKSSSNASWPYRRRCRAIWGTPTFDLFTLNAPSSALVAAAASGLRSGGSWDWGWEALRRKLKLYIFPKVVVSDDGRQGGKQRRKVSRGARN